MYRIIQFNEAITILQSKNALLNASIIENDNALLLIDTLLLPKDCKELYQYCLERKKPVKYIINTHWHSDHCYGNRFFDDFNPTIIAHELFWETISSEKNVIAPNKENIINKKLLRLPTITFSDKINIPEFDLTINHAPGHSFDSSRIYSHKYDVYWTGDNLLNSDDRKIAIPYFYWGNPNQLLKELQDLATLSALNIIPGHGLPTNLDKVKKDIIYLEKLLKFSKGSERDSLKQVATLRETYPCQPNDEFWVEKMHDLNLDKLLKDL